MLRYALDKPVQGPRSPLCEFCAESISPHIRHVVLLGKWWYSSSLIFFVQRISEEDKICEASSDGKLGLHEARKVCLLEISLILTCASCRA